MLGSAVRYGTFFSNTPKTGGMRDGDPSTSQADPDEGAGGLFEKSRDAAAAGIDGPSALPFCLGQGQLLDEAYFGPFSPKHAIAGFAANVRRQAPIAAGKSQESCAQTEAPRITNVVAPNIVAQPTFPDGSLPYDEKSLIGARVAAMKKLLGDEGGGRDAEQLLNIANGVHRDAVEDPSAEVVVQASMALWMEESRRWAQANGDGGADFADCLSAYLEMWSLGLNPPVAPKFKTRDAIALDYRVTLPLWKQGANDRQRPEVLKNYYSQFTTYIDVHLDRFCRAAVMAKAKEAALGLLFICHKPDRVWEINSITILSHTRPLGAGATDMLRRSLSCSAFVFSLPDGGFALIGAAGDFTRLPTGAIDAKGELNASMLSPLLRPNASDTLAKESQGGRVNKAHWQAYELSYRQIASGSRSIKDMMAFQIDKGVRKYIENWKEENYDAWFVERALNALIPFFETARKLQYDPGYDLQFKDIAFDLVGLALIVGTAGLAGMGGLKGVSLAVAAARAGTVSGKSMAGAVLRNIWARSSGKAFMGAAGRELTDFVVPVFSIRDLVKAIAPRNSMSVAAELVTRLHLADAVLQAAPPALMLDSIYGTLVRTRSVGSHISVSDLKAFIDEAADAAIPDSLFRGQAHMGPDSLKVPGLMRPGITRDDYLVACIKHSSRTGGGIDAPMSLSADRSVAARFASARPDGVVFTVDASKDAGNFRSIANILKYDGPRLVQEGKLRSGTLVSAIKNAHMQGEKEFFYMFGLIPDAYVKASDTIVRR